MLSPGLLLRRDARHGSNRAAGVEMTARIRCQNQVPSRVDLERERPLAVDQYRNIKCAANSLNTGMKKGHP
jgi:hypothetical protein